ncbi:MAG: iron complex outermembrane receptor protein, partial [Halieaceae bacterium]
MSSGIYYDVGFGYNEIDYFLSNTTNAGRGLGADGEPLQRDFDPGGYEQEELKFTTDFSKAMSETLNLAFGLEWCEETYTVVPDELNSYIEDRLS